MKQQSGLVFGLCGLGMAAFLLAGCRTSCRVKIDLPVKDSRYSLGVLNDYGVDASVDSSGNLLVPAESQQKAAMILTFKGLVDTGHAMQSKQVEAGDSGLVGLKIPVSDPNAAVRRLAVYGIPAECNLEKASVLIRKDQELLAAMVLTFTGMLPNGREAYGLFNESDLAITDHRTRMQYIARLQDMLAEVIAMIPNISQAEVLLTEHGMPWEFRKEDSKNRARASVRVETPHGGRLTEPEQYVVVSLVAGAFQNLTVSGVRVSDFNQNYYPTIDESWELNFAVRSRQRQLQRDAERKIEEALSEYSARAAVTIPMKEISAADILGAKSSATTLGTSGRESDAGRDRVHDPSRTSTGRENDREARREPNSGRDRIHDPSRNTGETTASQSTTTRTPEPDYSRASAAIVVIHKTELTADQISQIKRIASDASGVPSDRIQVMRESTND